MKVVATLEGVRRFLEAGILNPAIGKHGEREKTTCKRFYALLYWDLAFQSYPDGLAKTHVRECVADASSAYYLFLSNLYKPSLLCLRSSIENCLRAFCLVNSVDPSLLTTVPNLISEARAVNKFDGKSTEKVNQLYDLYGDLCEAVHSANENYLQKEVPFQNLVDFDEVKASTVLDKMNDTLKRLGEMFYITDHAVLGRLDAKSGDFVRDNLPKLLKRAVAQAD